MKQFKKAAIALAISSVFSVAYAQTVVTDGATVSTTGTGDAVTVNGTTQLNGNVTIKTTNSLTNKEIITKIDTDGISTDGNVNAKGDISGKNLNATNDISGKNVKATDSIEVGNSSAKTIINGTSISTQNLTLNGKNVSGIATKGATDNDMLATKGYVDTSINDLKAGSTIGGVQLQGSGTVGSTNINNSAKITTGTLEVQNGSLFVNNPGITAKSIKIEGETSTNDLTVQHNANIAGNVSLTGANAAVSVGQNTSIGDNRSTVSGVSFNNGSITAGDAQVNTLKFGANGAQVNDIATSNSTVAPAAQDNQLATAGYVNTQVGTETTRAKAVEANLATSISNEATRAQSAETALGNRIDSETTRAKAVEADLQRQINTNDMRARSYAASAGAGALAVVSAPQEGGLGASIYNVGGQSALAVGARAAVAERVHVTATISKTRYDTAGGVGVGWKW